MKFRKFLTIGIAALTVAAFSFGLAACKPDDKEPDDPIDPDNPSTPAEVTVDGGYAYYPPDQGGYGLELNLYEDGTFYYSQFTQTITYGTYTAEEGMGTDADGRTILYTVTFDENDVFGDETHNIVQDGETVYLTGIFDDMSMATYDFTKQDDLIEEIVQTVDQFWSANYAEDFVMVTFYSDETYALDGINGVGMAGSLGTYTQETAEDGTVTYTLTDGDDSSKVYTVTVAGSSITLTGTETDYTLTDINPNAVVELTLTGTNSWGASVVLTCYDDTTCNVQITLEGVMDFADASGTWSYMAAEDMYVFILNGTTVSAENDGAGSYTLTYKINAAQFGGEEVTLSYTLEEPLISYSFTYTPVLSYAAGETVNMVCNSVADAEEYTFTGSIWGGACTFTIVCSADGTCSGTTSYATDEGEGTWSQADGVITIEINGTTYTATAAE